MKTAKPYLLLLPILAFLLSCCEEEPEPDPCASLEPVTARFIMGERITNRSGTNEFMKVDTLIVSDTVLTWNPVQFVAPAGHDSYEWQVGTEEEGMKTYSGDSVVQIHIAHPWEALPVRLIVRDEPNTACFPQDDGVDTLTRFLTVIEREDSPVFGHYQGSLLSNPNEIFTVSFQVIIRDGPRLVLTNINKGCQEDGWFSHSVGYKDLSFTNQSTYGDGCNDPNGWLHLSDNLQDVVIEFSTGNPDDPFGERNYDTFIGTRID
jgi:hypothetical protein